MSPKQQLYQHLLSLFQKLEGKELEQEQDLVDALMFKGGILTSRPKLKPLKIFVANLTLNNPNLDWALNPKSLKMALQSKSPSDSINWLIPNEPN